MDSQAHIVPLARSRGGVPSISAALPLFGKPAIVGRLLGAANTFQLARSSGNPTLGC
jgi:hypothetical protein